jgi:hypothetical protein
MSIFFIFIIASNARFRGRTIRIGRCFQQSAWGDLARTSPICPGTTRTRALDAAIANDGIPVAISLGLVLGRLYV